MESERYKCFGECIDCETCMNCKQLSDCIKEKDSMIFDIKKKIEESGGAVNE